MAMLTPNRIRGYQFQQAGRGTYRSDEVDDFLNQIVESYEQVFKENGELVKKLSILATKLDEYRKEETSVRKALANAQNLIDRLVEEAKNEAEKIVTEAEERAKNVDAITNSKIKVMVDEVEGKMRVAYDKATAQAKQTKDSARAEAETILVEARDKSEKMVADAKAQAAEIISGATSKALVDAEELRVQIEKEKALLDKLKETSNQFKTEMIVLYERQIKNVEQMPDYFLNKELEETVKQIVDEKNELVEELEETVAEEEISEENFDADELINEYSSMNIAEDEVAEENEDAAETFAFNEEEFFEEELIAESAEETDNIPAFEETPAFEELEAIAEDVMAETPAEETPAIEETPAFAGIPFAEDVAVSAKPEATPAEGDTEGFFDFDFDVKEEKVEYEDVFSDSGNSEGFRFTAEDFDDINRAEAELQDNDFNYFSEEAADENAVYLGRTEPQRKLDIAFSDQDAVEIEKDENMFLSQDNTEVKTEQGFKLFDNIDFSENESFDMAKPEGEAVANDAFVPSDNDDSEGFSFLRNIFGRNKD